MVVLVGGPLVGIPVLVIPVVVFLERISVVVGVACSRVVAGIDVDSGDGQEGLEGDVAALVRVQRVERLWEVGGRDLDV